MFGAHLLATDDLVWTDPGTWSGLVDGRSSILFAVLAGVSVALLTGRTAPPAGEALVRARLVVLTRAALLLVAGGLVQLLTTGVYVILEFYAVLLALCVPLLTWSPRRLFALAAGWVAVVVPLFHQLLLPWVAAGPGGGVLGELAVTGYYPVVVWAAFVVTGLGVGRLDLTAAGTRVRLAGAGLGLAVVGYGVGPLLGVRADPAVPGFVLQEGATSWRDLVPAADQLLVADPHSGSVAEVVGSGGFALLVLAGCLWLADRVRPVLVPLAAVGSMPLTAYCVHLLGLAAGGDRSALTADQRWAVYLVFAVTALVACTAWSRLVGRGPLEQVVAAVTGRAVAAGPRVRRPG
ncbi:DUF418 domain-containing protein [Klenkia sp. PcliD-1-E]|nr:DUF418 domain-containing protein [Klenkia sp. PcliD-1-E]